jgi:hypothetical protein
MPYKEFWPFRKETTLIYLTNQDEINRQEVLNKSPKF